MKEQNNKNSEASLTRKDYKEKLGFNLFDSLIKFIENDSSCRQAVNRKKP